MFSRHPIHPNNTISLVIGGQRIEAHKDDTVASALLSVGLTSARTTPVSGAPRAPFCLMGVCFDCLMIIDGVSNQRACMTKVREGMTVEIQVGEGKLE